MCGKQGEYILTYREVVKEMGRNSLFTRRKTAKHPGVHWCVKFRLNFHGTFVPQCCMYTMFARSLLRRVQMGGISGGCKLVTDVISDLTYVKPRKRPFNELGPAEIALFKTRHGQRIAT